MSKYTSAVASVYLDMDSGYLSGVSGVLGLDSGYLSEVGQVNIPSCSTYSNIYQSWNTTDDWHTLFLKTITWWLTSDIILHLNNNCSRIRTFQERVGCPMGGWGVSELDRGGGQFRVPAILSPICPHHLPPLDFPNTPSYLFSRHLKFGENWQFFGSGTLPTSSFIQHK